MHNKHTIYTLTGISFAAFCLALSNSIVSSAHASNLASANASVTVDSTCTMNAAVTSEHSATMVNGTYSDTNYPNGIGSTTMQTFCNDANGYAIYAIGYTNNEEGNTVLKGGAGLSSDYDIVTGTATSGSGSSDISNWAMKVSSVAGTYAPTIVNGFNSFSNIPSSYTAVAKYNGVTDQNTTGSSITTTYAAYISNTQPAGTYTGQVKYVLVHPDFEVSTARTMQNIAEWEDELLPGVQVTTVDSRDGTVYTVAKLSDRLIWMTKNLDLAGGTTLTSADSNVSSDYTLPASSTDGFDDYTKAFVYNSDSTTCGYNSPCYSYYSYVAATAGTNPSEGNAASDICPKGWRLPTQAEYNSLISTYTTGDALTASPWYGIYAGYYNQGHNDVSGINGLYWSSTVNYDYSPYVYRLRFDSSGARVEDDIKQHGYSVRCVHEKVYTMQSVTASQLNTLMPNAGDTTKLRDGRDGTEYTIGKLADGNYWMLDNLALGSDTDMTLTNADTNMTDSSWTLKAGVTSGMNVFDQAMINVASKDTTQPLAMEQSGTGKVGVYYNYCAATVGQYCYPSGSGTTDASKDNDICPKNWRMPTGGDSGEYQALYTAYNSSNADFVAALKTPLSGRFYGSSADTQGSYGRFWSSTRDDGYYMYILYVDTSNVYPQSTVDRNYGLSVRCLFK